MNLLTDPLFRIQTDTDFEETSLPGLLTALGNDAIESLPGLQRHQEDAFYIFLCYLAAAVLDRENQTASMHDRSFWLDGLARLAGDSAEAAWLLIQPDPTRPAFMQPPLSEADAEVLKPRASTPDELDILPTAKNHDVKSARSFSARPDSWIFAITSLQTMAGFFGRGNYGIARMNGGFSSRICVELQRSPRLGRRWQRAVACLLTRRKQLFTPPWPYRSDGHVLLWTIPWDGTTSLGLASLDPFFIEISRIVRLAESEPGRISAFAKPSDAVRIEAKEQLGVLGDAWIPINHTKKGLVALTAPPSGLSPELLQRVIFADGVDPAFMQEPMPEDIGQSAHIFVSVLVRGQGTTDGFHSCRIPVPTRASFVLFGGGQQRERLGELSRLGLSDARTMQNKVLKLAIFSWLEAGPDKINFDKREVSAWVSAAAKAFTDAWSGDYFDWLWRTIEHDDENLARVEWLQDLQQKALTVLNDAFQRLPERRGRRYRARVKARGLFFGALNKHFPELKESRDVQRTA